MDVKLMNPVVSSYTSLKWASAFSQQPNTRSTLPSPKFFMPTTFYTKCMQLREGEILKKSSLLGSSSKAAGGSKRNVVGVAMPPAHDEKKVEEIFKSMEDWAADNIVPLLKPAKDCWQPQEFLPEPSSDGFHDQLHLLQARAKHVPDDYFVVLVGNMITEEALPTYHSRINATHIFHDSTGIDDTPWAVWARGWSAEENRHGDLLNKYLYLSARVDMKKVETSIHYLIGAGMDIGTSNNPYLWTIYTSFQERATAISHGNIAKLAVQHGDVKLALICGIIASDEKRHETAYTKIAGKLLELDPNGMLVAFAYMMRRKISMPAHLMYDGHDVDLFQHFSHVASRIGVYTASDYKGILEHLLRRWNVDKLTGLSGEGREDAHEKRMSRFSNQSVEQAFKSNCNIIEKNFATLTSNSTKRGGSLRRGRGSQGRGRGGRNNYEQRNFLGNSKPYCIICNRSGHESKNCYFKCTKCKISNHL